MRDRWERKTFVILLMDRESVMVDGMVMSEVPALGLHLSAFRQIDATHLPTGKRLGSFRALGSAVEFVQRIAFLRDWTVVPVVMTPEEEVTYRSILATIVAGETV